jgi:hypothetical protein
MQNTREMPLTLNNAPCGKVKVFFIIGPPMMLSMIHSLSAKIFVALLAFVLLSGTGMRRAREPKNPTIACLAGTLWKLAAQHHLICHRPIFNQSDQHGSVPVAQSLLKGAESR